MLDVDIRGGELHFDASVTIRFMRTLRIPDDGRECPLPAGLGEFPTFHVADYADRDRLEEHRVGTVCRSWWLPHH